MNLSCIIIEDEPPAVTKLQGFIAKVPFLSLSNCFTNALDGLQYLKTHPVDILFLDIQMEHLTGIQLLETLSQKPYVIITSAYADYALKGYELRVYDYLLKPYPFTRFLNAVNKVYDDAISRQGKGETESHIFVKTEYRLENIPVDNILWIEGMREYLQIVLSDKKIMTKQSFKAILEQLPKNKFIQVHKSWVVAITKIESIERNRIKIGNKLIPVGDTFKDDFYKNVLGDQKI
jgi:two-component system, LytTR family, response regulator